MLPLYDIEITPEGEDPTLFVLSANPQRGGTSYRTKPRRWEQHRSALQHHACADETVLSALDRELESKGTGVVGGMPLSSDTIEKLFPGASTSSC
jgi:hypothetical protein